MSLFEPTSAELTILLHALNDHESALCADYEAAKKANSDVGMARLSKRMGEVRALAERLESMPQVKPLWGHPSAEVSERRMGC